MNDCAMCNLSNSLNPRNIEKSVSDILSCIRLPFESSFWIFVSGRKLTILRDIQPADKIVIISGLGHCMPALKPLQHLSMQVGLRVVTSDGVSRLGLDLETCLETRFLECNMMCDPGDGTGIL